VAHFGSLKKIKAATALELTAAKGIGPALAEAVVSHLAAAGASGEAAPAVNMTTGEILEI